MANESILKSYLVGLDFFKPDYYLTKISLTFLIAV